MKKKIALVLCFVMLLGILFTGCSKTITVETNLTEITFAGAAEGKTGEAYTATLTPSQYYELPEAITVTVDGAEITGYTYDAATGALTIPADSVTGNLVITAAATESLVGTWTGSVDLTAKINELMVGTDEAMAEYFQFSDLYFNVTMSFTQDGTCTLAFDYDSIETLFANVLEQMKPGFTKLLEEMIASYGMDMSVEDFLSLSGYSSLDAFLEEQMDVSSIMGDMGDMDQTGNYLAADGVLYISDSLDVAAEIAEDQATPYTLENGVLTIEAGSYMDEESAELVFPLTLTRAS